ncbi:MAG: hypothetical protein OWS74_08585, partial [Firmicutes bacterium]|nr:hypothetical protein [Bacillota bacterium]
MWLLLASLTVGFQAGVSFWLPSQLVRRKGLLWAWMAVLPVTGILWWYASPQGLRVSIFLIGSLLVVQTFRALWRVTGWRPAAIPAWIEMAESLAALSSLMLQVTDMTAVVAGFIAGFAVPFILQDLLRP